MALGVCLLGRRPGHKGDLPIDPRGGRAPNPVQRARRDKHPLMRSLASWQRLNPDTPPRRSGGSNALLAVPQMTGGKPVQAETALREHSARGMDGK